MFLAAMRRGVAALGKGDEKRAARVIVRAAAAPEAAREAAALLETIDLIATMRLAPASAVAAQLAHAQERARSYWTKPGPYRLAAITALVLAHLVAAERLAELGLPGDIKRALALCDQARSIENAMPGVGVAGLAEVTGRIRALARRTSRKPLPKPVKRRPRAARALSKARSFRRGTLDRDELEAAAKRFRRSELRGMADELADYDGDAYLWEGDLCVDGDFCTSDADAIWLIVRGDLIVQGLYEDTCNDGPTYVLVEGSLRASDVITAGVLDVLGDLRVSGTVLGDYNDGGARIRGDLHARLYAPTDHPFRVDGAVRADYVLASAQAGARRRREVTAWQDLPLAEHFALDDLAKRLRKGQAILRDGGE